MLLAAGLLIILATSIAILRGLEVRLALLVAALTLGAMGERLDMVVRTFLITLSNEQFVIPICTAMGFAQVLKFTGCDQHLVQLLIQPIKKVRTLLIPGAVMVGFIVNIPVISQTSTAVAIGPVLVPLLSAAGITPVTTGAAILLGASIGGELLNPGAPELQTVSKALEVEPVRCVQAVWPLLFVQLAVATSIFWFLSHRAERSRTPTGGIQGTKDPANQRDFSINFIKAGIPLLPLVVLFLTAGPFAVFQVPRHWLLQDPGDPSQARFFASRLIGAAMFVGAMAAALVQWRTTPQAARVFFEGAGSAVTQIISLIVVASAFGVAVDGIGIPDLIGGAVLLWPGLLIPAAGGLPLAFAWISGSGMAATQSTFMFFTEPSQLVGFDPIRVGGVVSLSAAAGRTMSPVAAVALMSASLTGTEVGALCKRVAIPLLTGITVVILLARFLV